MKTFTDEAGARWVAGAREEDTPRHHGRWYLVFQEEQASAAVLPMPEVRWQTEATARRTLLTMSDFELRRRLNIVRARTVRSAAADAVDVPAAEPRRGRRGATAG